MINKNLIRIKNFFKKTPWFLGRRAFLTILIFIFLSLSFGLFLFYSYVIGIEAQSFEVGKNSFKFREDIYKKVLERWEFNSQKVSEFSEKKYLNPF